jgi:DNA-directed RNA polymerase specialized sigma24 family protein
MLGIVYFLARQNGPQVGCSGDAWELREIAEQLGVARETVTRRFPAILAKLQKQLLGYGLTEPVDSMLHG